MPSYERGVAQLGRARRSGRRGRRFKSCHPDSPKANRAVEQENRRTVEPEDRTCSTVRRFHRAVRVRETPGTVEPAMVSPGEVRHTSALAVDVCCDFVPNAAAARRGTVGRIADRTPDPFRLSVFICGSSPFSGRCASPAKHADSCSLSPLMAHGLSRIPFPVAPLAVHRLPLMT